MTLPTVRRRRTKTAAQLGEGFGVSARTVRRYIAEERGTYENRAAERRATAGRMAGEGASWAEIAEAVGGSEWSARALVRRHRQEQEQEQQRLKAASGGSTTERAPRP